jgi:peptidoglycan hydrolase-like protein with peptidoglycan-binding domain
MATSAKVPIACRIAAWAFSQDIRQVSMPVFRLPNPMRTARQMVPALLLSALLVMPAAAQEKQPNSATIQWAQQILDQQGFYQGRASGKLDSATAAAISAYQRKKGLKATGRLDQGTIDQLLQDQPERKGVGNLADPGSRARSSSPMLKESEVKPQAAPAAPGVDRGQGTENTLLGASRAPGSAPAAAPPAAQVESAPSILGNAAGTTTTRNTVPAAGTTASSPDAAPRSDVQAEGLDGNPVDADDGFDLANMKVPDWARYGLMGGIGLFVFGVVANLWWSGRRRRPARNAAKKAPVRAAPTPARSASGAPNPARREPSFGAPASAPSGRREPAFTAPVRDPRRLG